MNLNDHSTIASNISLLESQEPDHGGSIGRLEFKPSDCTDSNISPCKQDCSDYVGNIISRLGCKPSDCTGGDTNHLESKAVKYSQGITQ